MTKLERLFTYGVGSQMIVNELVGLNEQDDLYQQLEAENGVRHYDFIRSMILAALQTGREVLSRTLIKAINYHAIACLHAGAGEFRSHLVKVGDYTPPSPERVESLMDDFINMVNLHWKTIEVMRLAAHVLWGINLIHPFVNGNGRTARATAYFVICVKSKTLLPGQPILPELIRRERTPYVEALKVADSSKGGDLDPLIELLEGLLIEQLSSDETQAPTAP